MHFVEIRRCWTGPKDGCTWRAHQAAILRWRKGKTRSSSTFFFSWPVRRPNHCYYERSPVRTRAFFFSFVQPPCIPRLTADAPPFPLWLPPPHHPRDRFRPGQLHFFLGRPKNKTMIRIGIAPVPHLPRNRRVTSKGISPVSNEKTSKS